MNSAAIRLQLSRLTWLAFGVIEALLGFRIFFKLIGAKPSAEIVQVIYDASGWLMQPFQGIAGTPPLAVGVLDLPALIALSAYIVASGLIIQLLRVLLPPEVDKQQASQA